MTQSRDALLRALRRYAVREGVFELSSGGTSTWYLDARQVTFRGDCLDLVGRAVLDALGAAGVPPFTAVGGMTMGADPVALAVAARSGVRAFSVRKEPKTHGAGGHLAGPVYPDDRVLVVDDTVTTGRSLLQAVAAVREYGCEVVGATCLVDRGGVVGARLAELGVPFAPVLGSPDLGYEYGS